MIYSQATVSNKPHSAMAKRSQQNQKVARDMRKIFGCNLKRARTEAEITQGELEKRTGLTQQFISILENGLTTCSMDNAAIIAAAVRVCLCDLLRDKYLSVYIVNISYGEYFVGLVAVAETKEKAIEMAKETAKKDAGDYNYRVNEVHVISLGAQRAYVVEAGN